MTAFYNEFDPAAAHVLECLIKDGVIADGIVDRRSIVDIDPKDLAGFKQCHFFAGGGFWSVAARLAGWADERPMWTGSCPCQPFSVAGKGLGTDDPRHLWPHFHRLIAACRPPLVFGEQVSGKAGEDWFDGVAADLEGAGYACEAFDIPALAVNAPHIRQRLYWVAMADANGSMQGTRRRDDGEMRSVQEKERGTEHSSFVSAGSGKEDGNCAMADADGRGRSGRAQEPQRGEERRDAAERACGDMGDALGAGLEGHAGHVDDGREPGRLGANAPRPAPTAGFWDDYEWRVGADGKARRVKPGIRLLVDGFSDGLDRLRRIEQQAWEGVVTHAGNERNADETLRVLRNAIRAQARRKEQSAGMLFEFYEAEVLLDFLLCVETTRGGTVEPKMVPQACSEARRRIVRSLRGLGTTRRPSCGWEPDEQFSEQSSDPLLSLSFILARLAASYREAAFDAYAASHRVSLLRIAGNAIVPPLAAQFISAVMETIDA